MKIKDDILYPYETIGLPDTEYCPDSLEVTFRIVPLDSNFKLFEFKHLIFFLRYDRSYLGQCLGWVFDINLICDQLSGPELFMIIENKYKIIYRIRMMRYGEYLEMAED